MSYINSIHRLDQQTQESIVACEMYSSYYDIVYVLMHQIHKLKPSYIVIKFHKNNIQIKHNGQSYSQHQLTNYFCELQNKFSQKLTEDKWLYYLCKISKVNLSFLTNQSQMVTLNQNLQVVKYTGPNYQNFICISEIFANYPARKLILQHCQWKKKVKILLQEFALLFHTVNIIFKNVQNEKQVLIFDSTSKRSLSLQQGVINKFKIFYPAFAESQFKCYRMKNSIVVELISMRLKSKKIIISINGVLISPPPQIIEVINFKITSNYFYLIQFYLQENQYFIVKDEICIYKLEEFVRQFEKEYESISNLKLPVEESQTIKLAPRKLRQHNTLESYQYSQLNTKIKQDHLKQNRILNSNCNQDREIGNTFGFNRITDINIIKNLDLMQILGQCWKGFILGNYQDKLYLVDQHASTEKILYERYLKQPHQTRDTDVEVKVEKMYLQILKNNSQQIISLGWDYRIQKITLMDIVVTIKRSPFKYNYQYSRDQFVFLLESIIKDNIKSIEYPKVKLLAARRACSNSFKVGDKLDNKQMTLVLEQLKKADSPFNCPHGRPTLIELKDIQNYKSKIEKKNKYQF